MQEGAQVDLAPLSPSTKAVPSSPEAVKSAHAAPSPADGGEADVSVLPPRTTCCYPWRAPQRNKMQQALRAPASGSSAGKAAVKFSSAVSETVAAYGVSEPALTVFLAKLPPPSSASHVLDGQQLDSPEVVTQWRTECRRLSKLTAKLHDKESSHARLMSIRPHSVKTNEVKAYQGLYQAMMRLRTDSALVKSQKDTSQSVCAANGQLPSACVAPARHPEISFPPLKPRPTPPQPASCPAHPRPPRRPPRIVQTIEEHEAATVAIGGAHVPRVRISYLVYLQHAALHEHSARGGLWRSVFRSGRARRRTVAGLEMQLETPRGSERESARSVDEGAAD